MKIKCCIEFEVENHEDNNGEGIFADEEDFYNFLDKSFKQSGGIVGVQSYDKNIIEKIFYHYAPPEEYIDEHDI